MLGHEGKCRKPHGHNYVAIVYAERDDQGVDAIGRVVDFSVLKDNVGGWIEQHWDHKFLVSSEDTQLYEALEHVVPGSAIGVPFNPTAEEMAKFLLNEVCPFVLHGTGAMAVGVELWETENCKAEAWHVEVITHARAE